MTTGPIWPPKGRTPVHPLLYSQLCPDSYDIVMITCLAATSTTYSNAITVYLPDYAFHHCIIALWVPVHGNKPSPKTKQCSFAQGKLSLHVFTFQPQQCFEMHHMTKRNRLFCPNASFTQFGTSESLHTTTMTTFCCHNNDNILLPQ